MSKCCGETGRQTVSKGERRKGNEGKGEKEQIVKSMNEKNADVHITMSIMTVDSGGSRGECV